MVLVPQEVYDAWKHGSDERPSSTDIHNKKMHDILDNTQLPDDYKAKLYNHELQQLIDKKNITHWKVINLLEWKKKKDHSWQIPD